MAGFGLLDNLVRAGSDLHVLSGTRFESGLADAVSHSNPQRAVEEWKRGVLEAHPGLRNTLDNVGMARIHSAVAGERVYADFTDALVSGIDEARLASTADDYARRIVAEMSKTDGTLPTSGAEYDALLDVHRGRLLRGAEVFNENLTSRMAEKNLSRDEVIERYFRPEGGDDAAETTARNAEAEPVKPAGEDAAARTAASADDAASSGMSEARMRKIARGAFLRNTIAYSAIGTTGYLGAIYANNALNGEPVNQIINGMQALFGRETTEKIFGAYESVQNAEAQFFEGGAEHIFTENGYVNEEDLADPKVAHLIRAAALYGTGGEISAGMHLFRTGTGSQFLDAYGEVEARMIEEAGPDGDDPDRLEVARVAFLQVRDELRAERALAASVDVTTVADATTADTAVVPDTHQQGGSQAGTPAAVLAEQRRRAEDSITATGDESTASVLRQQTQGIFDGGLSLDTFSVAALTGSSLTAAFDAVAKDSWLLKIGNTIAGWMGEGVQSLYQSAVLKSHDKEEVYMALREAASEGRLVSNDPQNDRFGVMSLLDFAPNTEPEVS